MAPPQPPPTASHRPLPAHRVLHQELSAAKAAMAEFVHALQRQQAQQARQAPPGAAAPLRVK